MALLEPRARGRRFRARLLLSTSDANEAAIRMSLIRWARAPPLRGSALRSAAVARSPSQRTPSSPLVPVVLFLSDRPSAGHTWLLRGFPTSSMQVQCVPGSNAASVEVLRSIVHGHCYTEPTIAFRLPYTMPVCLAILVAVTWLIGFVAACTMVMVALVIAGLVARRPKKTVWRCQVAAVVVEPVCSQTGRVLSRSKNAH